MTSVGKKEIPTHVFSQFLTHMVSNLSAPDMIQRTKSPVNEATPVRHSPELQAAQHVNPGLLHLTSAANEQTLDVFVPVLAGPRRAARIKPSCNRLRNFPVLVNILQLWPQPLTAMPCGFGISGHLDIHLERFSAKLRIRKDLRVWVEDWRFANV